MSFPGEMKLSDLKVGEITGCKTCSQALQPAPKFDMGLDFTGAQSLPKTTGNEQGRR